MHHRQNRLDRRSLYPALRSRRPQQGLIQASVLSTSSVTLPAALSGRILAALRLSIFILSALFAATIAVTIGALGGDARTFRRKYYAFLAWVVGLKLIVRGQQSAERPRLVVCNHISYFDIVALGAVLEAEFVAKADVADWPFFGAMSKAARVVFINRKRSASAASRDQIQERLNEGATLIVFPEGTSGDGNRMRPFKSTLFAVAQREAKIQGGATRPVTVQPVSIAYTRLNGLPLGVGWRPFIAWYGDMDLGPHLWRLLQLGVVTAEITFHPAVTAASFPDRKALAAHCEQAVSDGFARLLAGREQL